MPKIPILRKPKFKRPIFNRPMFNRIPKLHIPHDIPNMAQLKHPQASPNSPAILQHPIERTNENRKAIPKLQYPKVIPIDNTNIIVKLKQPQEIANPKRLIAILKQPQEIANANTPIAILKQPHPATAISGIVTLQHNRCRTGISEYKFNRQMIKQITKKGKLQIRQIRILQIKHELFNIKHGLFNIKHGLFNIKQQIINGQIIQTQIIASHTNPHTENKIISGSQTNSVINITATKVINPEMTANTKGQAPEVNIAKIISKQ